MGIWIWTSFNFKKTIWNGWVFVPLIHFFSITRLLFYNCVGLFKIIYFTIYFRKNSTCIFSRSNLIILSIIDLNIVSTILSAEFYGYIIIGVPPASFILIEYTRCNIFTTYTIYCWRILRIRLRNIPIIKSPSCRIHYNIKKNIRCIKHWGNNYYILTF
jgi:hypothetical protein